MVATAILQTFLINGTIMIMFAIFGGLIMKRKRTRQTITLSAVFLVPAFGLLINILYRAIDSYAFNIVGNVITIYLTSFGLIHLFMFNLMLLKSGKAFTTFRQLLYTTLYGVLLAGLFVIGLQYGGVEWEYDGVAGLAGYLGRVTEPLEVGVPVWSVPFMIYGLVISQLGAFAVLYTGIKLYRQMGGKGSKYSKKFIRSIAGVILMDVVVVGNFIFNTLNTGLGRTILLVMSICIIPAGFFLYFGLRQK
ncbi:MAG: hypothetical protein ACTSWW_06570 [Promethearchaeota archaeon]